MIECESIGLLSAHSDDLHRVLVSVMHVLLFFGSLMGFWVCPLTPTISSLHAGNHMI